MTSRNTSAVVGNLQDLPLDSMTMKQVGEHPIAVIRTSKGVFALDNACPHQGYGLATGSLDVDPADPDATVITCQWHNWKFRASDGVCVMGEEDVACHPVSVADDGAITVSVTEPTPDEARHRLWPSLRRGIEADYRGQIARDTVRLLANDARPADVMWEAIAIDAPRNEYGPGHAMAMAADCLHLAEVWTGDDRALPMVQGLVGVSESSRDRPVRATPAPDATLDLGEAIASEQLSDVMAATLGAIENGDDAASLRRRFIRAVSNHHLGYGHGAIYTQKAFELLDRVGWERAPDLLPHVGVSVATSTREDLLPYMRKAMQQLHAVDLGALAEATSQRTDGWDPQPLADRLRLATEPPIELAAAAILQGGGVEGLLDAVSLAVSQRLLDHDLALEAGRHPVDFGWLDITHGLTYARAARWAWESDPGPHTARLALFTAWLAFDTGRAERRRRGAPGSGQATDTDPVRTAVAEALDPSTDRALFADRLAASAMDDRGGSFIVVAHLIKTTQAAREEADTIGSPLPLAAAARFVHAPRRERFVARSVDESLAFVKTGRPPKR